MKCNENINSYNMWQYSIDRDTAEKMLNEINQKHGYYGVTAINDNNHWDSYWGNVIGLCVETGDSYKTTFIYNTLTNTICIMSVSDYVKMFGKND